MHWNLLSTLLANLPFFLIGSTLMMVVFFLIWAKSYLNENIDIVSPVKGWLAVFGAVQLVVMVTIVIMGRNWMKNQVQLELIDFTRNDDIQLVINDETIPMPVSMYDRLQALHITDKTKGKARLDNSTMAYTYNVGNPYERTKSIKGKASNIYETSSTVQDVNAVIPFNISLVNSKRDSLNLIMVKWSKNDDYYAIYYPGYSVTMKNKISDLYAPDLSKLITPN